MSDQTDAAQRARLYADEEAAYNRRAARARLGIADDEYELEKLEAWLATEQVDGKNAFERKNNLLLQLEQNPDYQMLRQRIAERRTEQAEAEWQATLLRRKYHIELALIGSGAFIERA